MISDNPSPKPVIVAALVGSFLMLTFGLTYRVLAARLCAPANETPINPAVVERFPMQIGGWKGQGVPLDEAVVRKTGTDARISRRYSRGGLQSVLLYVACGVNAGHLMNHRPEVCYGLPLLGRHPMELPLGGGAKLPCTVFEFFRGGLDAEKVTVLDYFVVDGQYCGDISLLRSRAWRDFRAVGYVVQVQIVASTETQAIESAMRLVCAFAIDSVPSIARLIEDIEKDRSAEPTAEFQEGKWDR